MDRWKSRGGKSQRGEEQKREDHRRERVRRKKMQVREKVGTSRNTVFFQWFETPEDRKDRKVGSLKRRVRSHIWPDERWKIARRCGAKHILKSKCTKHLSFGPLLEVAMSKKCTPLWREAHFEVKSGKKTQGFGARLDVRISFCVAGTGDSVPCQKWTKRKGFVAVSTTTTATHTHTLHSTPLHSTPLHYTTLHYVTL